MSPKYGSKHFLHSNLLGFYRQSFRENDKLAFLGFYRSSFHENSEHARYLKAML